MISQEYPFVVTLPLISIACIAFLQCASPAEQTATDEPSKSELASFDSHSFSHPDSVVVTHLNLNLNVDFESEQLIGRASWTIDNLDGSSQLHLDTRDLEIRKVLLDQGTETTFELSEPVDVLGSKLVVRITPATKTVHIDYASRPQAEAVQWLAARQTAGGKHPFLFTQSQAILARTWVPCQDSPGVRFTYDAQIKVPPPLMAVMSAGNPVEADPEGVYNFSMPQTIPSYLLALAVGDLKFGPIGPRTGVYAEPSLVDSAAWEFAEVESMIDAAESLYGPYRWDRFDLLVLPPSFPFGGMENPRLTFATPTILAGDRSLVSLVAHELAHSWSGNLVTNKTWNDFWLNEGFTSYFENRIMEAVKGADYAEMLRTLSLQDLEKEIESLGSDSPDTHLLLNLEGRNPDDGMTAIAYDKGAALLRLLEETAGRELWDPFLKQYFEDYAFATLDTHEFLEYLQKNLLAKLDDTGDSIDVEAWLFAPGVPDNLPKSTSKEFARIDEQLAAWKAGTPPSDIDTEGWTTHHWLHFLRNLDEAPTVAQLQNLDSAYEFTQSNNSEVLSAWFTVAIGSEYQPAYPALEKFLLTVGRRKFLKPLYTELAETEKGLEWARTVYAKARPGYHSISINTLDEILSSEG